MVWVPKLKMHLLLGVCRIRWTSCSQLFLPPHSCQSQALGHPHAYCRGELLCASNVASGAASGISIKREAFTCHIISSAHPPKCLSPTPIAKSSSVHFQYLSRTLAKAFTSSNGMHSRYGLVWDLTNRGPSSLAAVYHGQSPRVYEHTLT